MQSARNMLRSYLMPRPLVETAEVRARLESLHHPGYPFCPPWQGDFLYRLCRTQQCTSALEVGFATGSTALYLLAGTEPCGGSVVSIDFRQSDFERLGCRMVETSPWEKRHCLIEENSNVALPRMYAEGKKWGLIFLDGWKTVDHLMLDMYYSARMLDVGGVLVFDDTRMKSVKRVNRLLLSHYAFNEVDYKKMGEDFKMWLWFRATTRSLDRPYRAFRKVMDQAEWPACKSYQFYSRF